MTNTPDMRTAKCMSTGDSKSPMDFVVGCPRSGTTLFATLLMRHFGYAVPFETHFVPLFWRWRRLYGNLELRSNRARLLCSIYRFEAIYLSTLRSVQTKELAEYSLIATRPNAERILDRSRNYSEIVQALFIEYANLMGCSRAADYTTFTDYESIETIDQAVPGGRFIHIVRDGRDVYASWRKTWSRPANVVQAADVWSAHIRGNSEWGEKNPDRYLELRYEALLHDPAAILMQVADFLGLRVDDDVCSQAQGLTRVLSATQEHRLLLSDIQPNNTSKWPAQLNTWECTLFEHVAHAYLTRHDYFLAGIRRRAYLLLWSRYGIVLPLERMAARFTANWVKRRLKNILPLVLWTVSWLQRQGFGRPESPRD